MTRYELLERIGAGGMAEIFRGKAVAAGGFEKPVAIKRILPHLSQDPRFVELLIAEAKILSQLRHRNIVQIFDVGLGDDGQYFLVMEFVDGVDMGAVQRALEARRKRLPLDLVLHLGAEVCEALEHAHTSTGPDGAPMRLVHRDVSPSNVLVSRAGEVKLTDFGIAKRPEEHTGHGSVRGKFAYISPEQAENRHVDARSDVWSLGVVLFELVAGRRLFSQLPDLDALKAVREGKVPRPRELDPALPLDVEDALMSVLARDPAARLPSAAALGARLRSIRYALESAAGDPASELARIVGDLDARRSEPGAAAAIDRTARGKKARVDSTYEHEPTVVRIRTADGFSAVDDGTAILRARQVLERFEEEETRMSRIGGGVVGAWDEHATASGPIAAPAPAHAPILARSDDGADEETNILEAPIAPGRALDAAPPRDTLESPAPRLPRGKRQTVLPLPRTAARIAAERAASRGGTDERTARSASDDGSAAVPGSASLVGRGGAGGLAAPRALRADSSTTTPSSGAPSPRADGSSSSLPRAERIAGSPDLARHDPAAARRDSSVADRMDPSAPRAPGPQASAQSASARLRADAPDGSSAELARASSAAPSPADAAARRKRLWKIGAGASAGIAAVAIIGAMLAGGEAPATRGAGFLDGGAASSSADPGSTASRIGSNAGVPGPASSVDGAGHGTDGSGTHASDPTAIDGGLRPDAASPAPVGAARTGSADGSGTTGSGAATGSGATPVHHATTTPIHRAPVHKSGTKSPATRTAGKTTTKPGTKSSTKTSTKSTTTHH